MLLSISFFCRLASSLDFASLSQTGIISNQTGIILNITATDSGIPRLSSSMTLIVNIIDINEENPYFNSTVYYASIEENKRKGSHVTQVAARKKSLRNILTYSFVTTNSWFNIDVNTVSPNSKYFQVSYILFYLYSFITEF